MEKHAPIVSIIAALSDNRVIGIDNRLPWHLPADLKHFKALTIDKPIVMGRRTWESLPGLLPRRTHIVITASEGYRAEGAKVVASVAEALSAAGDVPEIMVVGGARVYQQVIPVADRMYLTRVHTDVDGDTWFPDYDETRWRVTESRTHHADERNPCDYTFTTLERESPDKPL